MSEIKSISVEEAAKDYGKNDHTYKSENAFLAGAEWQKEQDKEFIQLAWKLLVAYDTRYPNAKQLLLSITNEDAFNKLSQLI